MEAEMRQLEVLATDGKVQKRILWMKVTPEGIYIGDCMETSGDHFSYHVDGNVFWTRDNKPKKTASFQPLEGFKGIQQIVGFAFSSSLSGLRAPAYKMSKLRAVAYIDVRDFSRDSSHVGCNVLLLEPGRFDLLSQAVPTLQTIHLFLQFEPWIVLEIYKVSAS